MPTELQYTQLAYHSLLERSKALKADLEAALLQNEELKKELASKNVEADSILPPQYPTHFEYFSGDYTASEIEVQAMINEAHEVELENGGFTYRTLGDTLVITLKDEGELVTVVANNFHEHIRPDLVEDAKETVREMVAEIGKSRLVVPYFTPAEIEQLCSTFHLNLH